MAYSFVTFTGDGSTTNFAFSYPYMAESDMYVSYDLVDQAQSIMSWTNPNLVVLSSAPASGVAIKLYRNTPKVSPLAVFTAGAFNHSDLNDVITQLLYVAQETLDTVSNTAADAAAAAVSAASAAADAVQTALDRIATAADVVLTNADVVSTNADVAQTTIDKAATAADVVLTNADVVSTAADAATATTQASNASTSASNAATSETNAAASYDNFDDRYLGSKASDPTLDNDGDALLTGAQYWNTGDDTVRVYDGAAWQLASPTTVPDNAIDLAKLAHGTAGKVLGFDGSGVPVELSAGNETDIRLAFLLIAENAGDAVNMVDGIADPYMDETDVDTATSTNESYDAAGDFYAPESGGIDSYATLVLHMDGTDASTTFTDSSTSPHTLTAYANAQIDTAQSKFGGASGLFDGTGDYVYVPHDTTDWAFGTADFTIDCHIRTGSASGALYAWRPGSSTEGGNWFYININGSGYPYVYVGNSNSSNFAITGSVDVSDGAWHHIALVRSSGTTTLYVDGVADGTSSTVVSIPAQSSGSENHPSIGCQYSGGSANNVFNGHIDEFRISTGIARWTANFTPPTIAYSSAPLNLTLASNAFTADTAPATGRAHVQVKENEAITINTDLTAEVSRDGGTTWTMTTLALKETLADGTKAYEDASVDISGQPSGTSMKYRHKTLNNKDIELHGTVFQWA